MSTLVVGIAGALGGGLISLLTSMLTLRSTHRAEQTRWVAERRWEHGTGLVGTRREAYARFLSQQNAMIMAVGETMHDAQGEEKVIHQMPAGQAAVYGSLQDAYAQSLLLAGPALRKLLIENQNYLDQLVLASWRGEGLDARDNLFSDVLAAMHEEVVELPQP